MVGRSTQHELEIRAFVRDLASKQLRGLRGEVSKTTAQTKTAARATTTQTAALGGLSGALGKAAIGFAGVTTAVVVFERAISTAIRASKDLTFQASRLAGSSQEIQSAFGFTFGDQAPQAQAQIEEFASRVGRFTDDLKDAAVAFQLMLEPMVGASDQAAQLSVLMTQLGTDLGSFRDVAPDEAMGRLQSALAGNTEALRTLVGFIDDATVKQAVFNAGIAEAGQELTQSEKTYGRVAVLADRLATAIGDAERTQTSFANTAVRLSAAFKEQLLPAGRQVNDAFLSLLNSLGGVETVGKAVGIVVADLANSISFALATLEFFGPLIDDSIDRLAKAQSALGNLRDTALNNFDLLVDKIGATSTEAQALVNILRGATFAGGSQADTDAAKEFLETLERVLAKWRESLAAARAVAEEEQRIVDAREFSAKLADQILVLERDSAETVEERVRAEQKLSTAAISRIQTQAQELGIASDIAGEVDQYRMLMEKILRTRINAIIAAEEERKEQAKITAEVDRNRATLNAARGAVGDLAGAFGDLATGANTFDRALDNILANVTRIAAEAFLLRAAFSFLTGGLGLSAGAVNSFFGTDFLASAKGNVFDHGSVVPFAKGGIVTQPQLFDIGAVAERGAEGILPLARDGSGNLGVRAVGGNGGGSVGTVIAPGAIQVIAQPGMSPEQIGQAVMQEILRNSELRTALSRVGGVS